MGGERKKQCCKFFIQGLYHCRASVGVVPTSIFHENKKLCCTLQRICFASMAFKDKMNLFFSALRNFVAQLNLLLTTILPFCTIVTLLHFIPVSQTPPILWIIPVYKIVTCSNLFIILEIYILCGIITLGAHVITLLYLVASYKLCRKWGFEKLVYRDATAGIRRDRKYAHMMNLDQIFSQPWNHSTKNRNLQIASELNKSHQWKNPLCIGYYNEEHCL